MERTFLILDDEDDNRVLARLALLRAFPGSHVLEAADADQALRVVEGVALDGVVTDHHLSTLDGATFVRRLRGMGVGCPVIMVTSSIDPSVRERAYAAGADRVFADNNLNYIRYLKTAVEKNRR